MPDCRLLNRRRVLLCAPQTITCPTYSASQEDFFAFSGWGTVGCRYRCAAKAENDARWGHLLYCVYGRGIVLVVALRPEDVDHYPAHNPNRFGLLWRDLGMPAHGSDIRAFFEALPKARRLG